LVNATASSSKVRKFVHSCKVRLHGIVTATQILISSEEEENVKDVAPPDIRSF